MADVATRSTARHGLSLVALIVVSSAGPGRASSQGLADFDYENLNFRGVAPEFGWMLPNRVEPTVSLGARMDLGYLGPGVRLTAGITYWSSDFKEGEVREFEDKIRDLVVSLNPDSPPPVVDLGAVTWTDVAVGIDGHMVWSIPFGFLSYAGLGLAAHVLNGSGTAVDGTFVEDLLDRLSPALSVHGGLEYPFVDRVRLYGLGRWEVMEDLNYFEVRAGVQIMFGPPAPGERGGG